MIHLATFGNEIEAQLLGSQLSEADIDFKTEHNEGSGEFRVMVFADDLEEAKEIMEARSMDDADFIGGIEPDDEFDLDEDEF